MSEQNIDEPDSLSIQSKLKIFAIIVLIVMSFSQSINGDFWAAMGLFTIAVFLTLYFINQGTEKSFFDDNLEPGTSKLKPCANCGENQMRRIQHKIYLPNEYRCDSCGYKSNKEEAERSILDATLADLGELEETSIGGIENDELREDVRDRLEEGWEIEEIDNNDGKVILKTTKGGTIGGHALTGITTGLWTFGAGNVAYSKLSKKKNAERMVLRAKNNLPEGAAEPKQLPNISDKLRELKELHDDGIITEREFQEKRKSLLEEY